MTSRHFVSALALALSLFAFATAASAEQTQMSPMAAWLAKLVSIRQDLAAVKIPPFYCEPPKTPQRPPHLSQLRTIGLRLREAENELRAIEGQFRKLLPEGHRLNVDDPRVKDYPPIGRVDILAEGKDGIAGGPYFVAAWRVFHDANTRQTAMLKTVESMTPRPCVETPGRQPTPEDPLKALNEPDYFDISLPLPAPCYQSADTKRGVYNRAYQEQQEALQNIGMTDDYIHAIEDLQVHYANSDGPVAVRQRLAKMKQAAEGQRGIWRTEFENAEARLNTIYNTPVPCPTTLRGRPGPRPKFAVLGGTGFGSGEAAPANPISAGPPITVPGNRTHTTVPTQFVSPGKDVLNEVLDLLDEAEWLDYFGYFGTAEWVEWEAWDILMGMRLFFSFDEIMNAEPRLRPYIEGYVSYLDSAASIRRLVENARSVGGVVENGLLNANPTSSVLLRTSDAGGYKTSARFGGGVEIDLRRNVLGLSSAVRTGVSVIVPIGSPREQTFALDSSFIASSVTFAQTDEATFTTSLGTGWAVQAGLTLSRPLTGRMGWSLDVDLEARYGTSVVMLTTKPVTTSSQPGAIVFSTPPGSATMVISTAPGVLSTVSTALTNYELAKSSGWSVGPVVKVGITF